MDYLTPALVLIGIGVFLLVAEVLVPTGGILVVAALLFFALGVGTILYYGTTIEAVVAIVGLAVGLPAFGYVAVSAWGRMSLDSALDEPTAAIPSAIETDPLKGRTGKTVSPLRPSGTVEIDGKRVDAMTEGTMLAAGVWVRCVDVRRGQVIVRKIEDAMDESDPPAPPPLEGAKPLGAAKREEMKPEVKKPPGEFDDFDIGLEKL
jgi:membrane-bound serine protease (ClpP class)